MDKKGLSSSRPLRVLLMLGVMVCAGLVLGLIVSGLSATAMQAPPSASGAVPRGVPEGKSTIGDFVWHDTNVDGFDSPGEPGINNVLVKLYRDNGDGFFDAGTDTYVTQTLTGDNPSTTAVETGWYTFNADVTPALYWVVVDATNFAPGGPLNGYAFTSAGTKGANPQPVNMPPGITDYKDADFGYALPGLKLVKTAGNAPDGGTLTVPAPGAVVTYTYTVTNTGETYLAPVVITDDNGTPANLLDDFVACSIPGPLAPNTSAQCTWSGFIGSNRTNVATAVGTPTDVNGDVMTGTPPKATDDAKVIISTPAATIRVTKTANPTVLPAPGGPVQFTVRIDNLSSFVSVTISSLIDSIHGNLNGKGTCAVPQTIPPGGFYQCTFAATVTGQAGYIETDTVTATGTDANGNSVSGQASATVTVVKAPALTLDKQPPLQYVTPGGTATFTITVTNTGGFTLTNVTVSDPLAPGCARNVGTLNPGQSTSYQCTVTNVLTGFVNVATATGTPPPGVTPPTTTSPPAQVIVPGPGLSLDKQPPLQYVNPGGTATFTITVTNTGDITLTNVTVSDPLAPGCVRNVGTLNPGQSTSYQCTVTNVLTGFINVATATGTPPPGVTPPTTTSPPAQVIVARPGLALDKQPPLQYVNPGGTATFTITVTNTGDVTLTNVTVSDPLAPNCVRNVGTLIPGQGTSYQCTVTNVLTGFINVATATGTPPPGVTPPTTTSPPAQVIVARPGLSINKQPPLQYVNPGGTATFTITVTNTGDVTLTNVTVSDPLAPNCARNVGTLTPGQATSYQCTVTNVLTGFINVATGTGTPPPGVTPPTTTSPPAQVIVPGPGLSLNKQPPLQYVNPGGTAVFTITVTNTGDITLTNVTVSDPLAPDCVRNVGTLNPGQATSYQCTVTSVQNSFVNVATATGTPPPGVTPPTTTSPPAQVIVARPGLALDKQPPLQYVVPGGTATFTITVTNTGDITLTNVTVSDPQAPNCARNVGTLNPGQSTSYQCTVTNVLTGFINVATGTGTPPPGVTPPTTTSPPAQVIVPGPGLSLNKQPPLQYVNPGGTAVFTITVTNTGDITLTNVTVSDPLAPGCVRNVGTLTPGQATSYQCTVAGVLTGFTNVATGTGTPPPGVTPPTTTSPPAQVVVPSPGLALDKQPPLQYVNPGGTAVFTITVTNTGDITLTNVTVSDPLAPNCVRNVGTLNPGQSVSFQCTVGNVQNSFTNVATATGTPPPGVTPPTTTSPPAQVIVARPGLALDKQPPLQYVTPGGTATFTITVTNTGDITLTNVTVSDPLAPGCVRNVGTLNPGQSTSYQCTVTNVQAGFINVATGTGTPPPGVTPPTTTSPPAQVIVPGPGLSLNKQPPLQYVNPGGTAVFTITVTNTGDITLTNVTVSDPLAPGCVRNVGTLTPGQATSYQCTVTNVQNSFINVATGTGTPPPGVTPPTTTSPPAQVIVARPGLTLDKQPPLQYVNPGGTATFTITVTNTGDVTLTNVTVSDLLAPGCVRNVGTLIPGQSTSYQCTVGNVQNSFTNVATGTGTPPPGVTPPTTTSPPAQVVVARPGLALNKQPALQYVVPGGTATFTITVTNTGDVTLTNVTVSDPLAAGCRAQRRHAEPRPVHQLPVYGDQRSGWLHQRGHRHGHAAARRHTAHHHFAARAGHRAGPGAEPE